MLLKNKKVSLRFAASWLAFLFFGIFFGATLFTQSYTLYKNQIESNLAYKVIISDLIFESIKAPLLQGSFSEAQARLHGHVESGQIQCALFQIESFDLKFCNSEPESKIKWYNLDLLSIKELSGYSGNIKIGFDIKKEKSALIAGLIHSLILAFVSSILIAVLSHLLFKMLEKDVLQLIQQLNTQGSDLKLHFRTYEFDFVYRRLRDLLKVKEAAAKNDIIISLSKQVAHDIRSPLSALKVAMDHLSQKADENVILAKSALARIEGIASNLLKKPSEFTSNQSAFYSILLQDFFINFSKLKMNEFENQNFKILMVGLTTLNKTVVLPLSQDTLFRILSNLINNSVEAFDFKFQDKVITLSVTLTNEFLQVSVKDNGTGISPQNLERLNKSGGSFGKEASATTGYGLGLSYAKTELEKIDGLLKVFSTQNVGTTIVIQIPIQNLFQSSDS